MIINLNMIEKTATNKIALNIGRLSIANMITFALQILAAVLCLIFAVMNFLFYNASEIDLHKFFGDGIPQGAFASSQDGFIVFCIVFAALGIILLAMLFCLFITRGQGKKSLYYSNQVILAVACVCGIYYLFGFHLVVADISIQWELILNAVEALDLDLFSGVEYPWPEEFIAIFSGIAALLMCRKKARKYMIYGEDA